MSRIDGVAPFVLIIEFGRDYRCNIPGQFLGKIYRPFCVAWHHRRHQEEVVYEGITGPDKGRWMVCTLDDWATRFELIEEKAAEPAQPVENKGVAGEYPSGPGF
jgi:hypothetical protein